MTDSEKLNKIEKYILDLERSLSDILADNSRFKVKFEKFDKMSTEIAALRKDFNTLSQDFHDFKGKALTYDGFERLIDSMLTRTEEISEIRITTRKHETDIRRVEGKIDTVSLKVNTLSMDVEVLKTDVAELKTDVAELKTDVAELKTDVAELKTDVAELKIGFREMKTEMQEGFSLLMQELKSLKKS